MKRIKSDIAKKNFEKCYLLYGGESFLRDLYVKRLKNAVAGGSFSEMNTDVFNGAVDINRIIDASETIPFMSDKRLLIIKDSGLFKAGRKNDSELYSRDDRKPAGEHMCSFFRRRSGQKA